MDDRRQRRDKNILKLTYTVPLFLIFLVAGVVITLILRSAHSNSTKEDPLVPMKLHIDQIAQVRVVDTPGHHLVREYITSELKSIGLDVEHDIFVSETPLGNRTFTNIIGYFNKNADKHLIIAAHYDSKLYENFKFVGAIDSAVSCAMIIEIARYIQNMNEELPNNWGIAFVFFDGEEAFVKWSPTDSLYGSRHLAEKWSEDVGSGSFLSQIDMFILLDLLGSHNTILNSRYSNTDIFFDMLVKNENFLRKQEVIEFPRQIFAEKRKYNQSIGDDHEPFLKQGIRVVHLIPTPFPKVWHTKNDTVENVHFLTVQAILEVLKMSVFEFISGKQS